jgi:hypothetical protein
MKTHIIHIFIFTISFAAFGMIAEAQTSEPRTLAELFLLVPERYMDGYDRAFREELLRGEHRGAVIDIANGYISYDASDNPTGFEFVIFKKKNGNYLVAFSDGAFADAGWSEESGNWNVLHLLTFERGRWRDVRSSVLPVPFDKKLAYTLPRKGRTIKVWDTRGRNIYDLTWKNDRFHVIRKPRK